MENKRGNAAEKWYKFLCPFAPESVFVKTFKVYGSSVNKITSTTMSASVIASCCGSGTFKILDANSKIIVNATQIEIPDTEEGTGVVLKCYTDKLSPNQSYQLVINLVSADELIKEEITLKFKTPQSYPKAVKSVEFKCLDEFTDVDSEFSLKISKPDNADLGYWGDKNDGKLEVYLIVNGKIIDTYVEADLKINKTLTWTKFTLADKFSNVDCKVGDTIQIGTNIKVKVAENTFLDAPQARKSSDTICILNKPIQTFLNVKD
jgi:hypothetical protein